MADEKQYLAKILIVEDNRLEAALLESLLKRFGCTVLISRGLDIVDKMNEHYDLIFLDINMPGIDGFYIANTFKKSSHCENDIPLVVVSAQPCTNSVKSKCEELGISDYIKKPITEEVVARLLSKYIQDKEIIIVEADNAQPFGD